MAAQRWIAAVAACAVAMCVTGGATAGSTLFRHAASEGKWDEALAAFAAEDQKRAPPPGGVLFVGSSSIRLWENLESDFRGAPIIIKRGFGGSRLTDCVKFLDRLVIVYRPREVVLYAGDNDIAEGSTPQQVLERVKAFAAGVHSRLPETRIIFISIKPSLARRALIPKVRAANRLVREYASLDPWVDYADIFTPMLTAEGAPRRELFRKDALHLNERGYALWRSIIRPFLR